MNDSVKISEQLRVGSWSSRIDQRSAAVLKESGVRFEPIDPFAVRLHAVPLSKHFSKQRTNLLVHLASGQVRAYVDIDLAYNGPNGAIRAKLSGPRDRQWRRLAIDIPVGDVSQVVCATLAAVDSPLATVLQVSPSEANPSVLGNLSLDPQSILAIEMRAVEADELAAAFRSSNHKQLARRLAAALTRQPPCCCVVWAASGAGKGHLLRTTAHILAHGGHVRGVRYLTAGRLTCGRVFPTERDGVLTTLLDELVDHPQLLLLVDQLELAVSGTTASFSLLAEALDRGARVLATVEDQGFLKEVQTNPALARRLLPIQVPAISSQETLGALQQLVRARQAEVSPAALHAIVEMTERDGATQPAAALDLLRSALAEAPWRKQQRITPDDITSVLKPDWPV